MFYCTENRHSFLIHEIFEVISCLVRTLGCTVCDTIRLKNKLLILTKIVQLCEHALYQTFSCIKCPRENAYQFNLF